MIYDYKCTECGEVFEVWATLAEKEKGLRPQCPKCKCEDTRQMMAAVGLAGSSNSSGNTDVGPMCGPAAGPGCC